MRYNLILRVLNGEMNIKKYNYDLFNIGSRICNMKYTTAKMVMKIYREGRFAKKKRQELKKAILR